MAVQFAWNTHPEDSGGGPGEAVLAPANPAYPVLRPGERLQIFGVVVGLVRSYRR